MATKLMGDAGLLDQPLGHLICCSAMIDDVASLVLLAMISNSASGTESG
jgi:Kef-type K+ transport system membrane component KefB